MNYKQKILDYLATQQQNNGEFQSFCCLPDNHPREWYYTGDSPFASANILFCLRNLNDPKALEIRKKGINYLLSQKEKFNLWRYWAHNNGIMEYNVPADTDDTALVAFLLKKNGENVDNTLQLIKKNKTTSDRFYTWFLPRYQFLSSPRLFSWLCGELIKTAIVFLPNPKIPKYEPISSPWDSEQGVGAHAIMALGGADCPKSIINRMVEDVENDKLSLQYYDHKLYTYHHISRAFSEGTTSFSVLANLFLKEIEGYGIIDDHENEFYLLNVLNYLTLKNFNLHSLPVGQKLLQTLQKDEMLETGDWKPFKYWTSKQRSWWAGSAELTAALYLEAIY